MGKVFQDVTSSGGGDALAMTMEDMTEDEKRAYLTQAFGGGASGASAADAYMRSRGSPSEESVEINDPNATSKQYGCTGIANGVADSFKLSRYFTVGQLSSGVYQPSLRHAIPSPTALGLQRADIICNLKHLALNSIDRCQDYLSTRGYTMQIGSGFRNETGGSDHNRGSAVDMHIFKGGVRVTDMDTIIALAKGMIESGIPYTQVIAEISDGRPWIHWANRKNGVKSGKKFFVLRF